MYKLIDEPSTLKDFFLNNRKEWFWRSIIIMIDTRPQIDVPLPFTRVYLIFRNIEVCQRWLFIRRFWIEVIAGLYEKKINFMLFRRKKVPRFLWNHDINFGWSCFFLFPFLVIKTGVCVFLHSCLGVTTPYMDVTQKLQHHI